MLSNPNYVTMQVYEKTLTIQVNPAQKQNIARAYNCQGKEVAEPLQFEHSHKGFQRLRHWVKAIVTEA